MFSQPKLSHRSGAVGFQPMSLFRRYYGDAIGNRTRVSAVKGPCLNRLTMAP